MKRVFGVLAFLSLCFGLPAASHAQQSATTANYRDLSQSPGPYKASTPAQVRAKTVADAIANNWLSFRIALAMPADPADRPDFGACIQANANPQAVKAYLDQVAIAGKAARVLVGKGTNAATDGDVASFVVETDKMRKLEIAVSNDNPQPDGSELDTKKLKPVLDSKAKHVINDLSKLGEGGGIKLNDVPAGDFKNQQDLIAKSRIHDIVVKAGATGHDKTKLEVSLPPLVTQEINGALWQYREIIALIVGGLDQPDQTAMDVFNTVLDELQHNAAEERHLE